MALTPEEQKRKEKEMLEQEGIPGTPDTNTNNGAWKGSPPTTLTPPADDTGGKFGGEREQRTPTSTELRDQRFISGAGLEKGGDPAHRGGPGFNVQSGGVGQEAAGMGATTGAQQTNLQLNRGAGQMGLGPGAGMMQESLPTPGTGGGAQPGYRWDNTLGQMVMDRPPPSLGDQAGVPRTSDAEMAANRQQTQDWQTTMPGIGDRGPLGGVASRPEKTPYGEEAQEAFRLGYTMNQVALDRMEQDLLELEASQDQFQPMDHWHDQQKLANLSRDMEDEISRQMVAAELSKVDEDDSLTFEEKLSRGIEIAQERKERDRQDHIENLLDLSYGSGKGKGEFENLVFAMAEGEVLFTDIYNNPNTSPAVKKELARLISDPAIRNVLIPPRGNVNAGFNGGAGNEQATLGAWSKFTSREVTRLRKDLRQMWEKEFKDVDPTAAMPFDIWQRYNGPTELLSAKYEGYSRSQEAMGKDAMSYDEWIGDRERGAMASWEYRKDKPRRDAERSAKRARQKTRTAKQRRDNQRRKDARTNMRSHDPRVRSTAYRNHPAWEGVGITEQAADWYGNLSDSERQKLHWFFIGDERMAQISNVQELENLDVEIFNAQMGFDSEGRSLGSDSNKAVEAAEQKKALLMFMLSQSPMAQSIVAAEDADNARMIPLMEEAFNRRKAEEQAEMEMQRELLLYRGKLDIDREFMSDLDPGSTKITDQERAVLRNQRMSEHIINAVASEGFAVADGTRHIPTREEVAQAMHILEHEVDPLEVSNFPHLEELLLTLRGQIQLAHANPELVTGISSDQAPPPPPPDAVDPEGAGYDTESAEPASYSTSATVGALTGVSGQPWSNEAVVTRDGGGEVTMDWLLEKAKERLGVEGDRYLDSGDGPWALSPKGHQMVLAAIHENVENPMNEGGVMAKSAMYDIYEAVMKQMNFRPKAEWLNR